MARGEAACPFPWCLCPPVPLTCTISRCHPAAVSRLKKLTSKPCRGGNGNCRREMSHQRLALPELLHFKLCSSKLRLRGPPTGREERTH